MNKEGLISRILRNQEMVLPTPRYRGLTIKQILNLDTVEGQEPKNIKIYKSKGVILILKQMVRILGFHNLIFPPSIICDFSINQIILDK